MKEKETEIISVSGDEMNAFMISLEAFMQIHKISPIKVYSMARIFCEDFSEKYGVEELFRQKFDTNQK